MSSEDVGIILMARAVRTLHSEISKKSTWMVCVCVCMCVCG
jgi:hypothetical protein